MMSNRRLTGVNGKDPEVRSSGRSDRERRALMVPIQ